MALANFDATKALLSLAHRPCERGAERWQSAVMAFMRDTEVDEDKGVKGTRSKQQREVSAQPVKPTGSLMASAWHRASTTICRPPLAVSRRLLGVTETVGRIAGVLLLISRLHFGVWGASQMRGRLIKVRRALCWLCRSRS
ncbi:MAG: hypothetical protein NC311_14660 [Muribaculaceae bacterium]|nr:hypothetical protein [Muribaculaceae bacterium]